MRKVLFYLKRSWKQIILILVLLAVQAMCDLSLPDYTSRIINVGVQQGGIEYASPEAIEKEKLEEILLFASTETSEEVFSYYGLKTKENTTAKEWEQLVKKYPNASSIYVLKENNEKTWKEVSKLLSRPMLIDMMLTGEGEESKQIQEVVKSNLPSTLQSFDLMTIFQMMKEEERSAFLGKIEEQFASFPESMVDQSAVAVVKIIYQDLGMNTDRLQTNYILISGAKMLGLALISMLTAIGVVFLGSRTAARLARELREAVYEHVLAFGPSEFKKFGVASLITRSTNDIQQVQMLIVFSLRIICYAPIIGIGGVFKALNANSSMAWIIAVAVMTVISLVGLIFALAMPKFKKVQKLIDRLNQVTREILSGIPVVRAFSNERYEEKRFDVANTNLKKTTLFVDRIMSIMMPSMMFVMNAICILIIWKGAEGIDTGMMQVGDMLAFIQYTMQIVMAFLMISMFSIMFPRANVSIQRIGEVLSTEPLVKDPKNPIRFTKRIQGLIEFKNVSFRYPDGDEDVLTDITFTAKPGTTTAFIGSTGSGKSTLINLIPRLYDVTKGEILVDGINVKEVTMHDLHEKIGFVPQKGVLFSGTISSNILYGNKNGSKEEMLKAARISQSTSFIEEKEDGYDTSVSQGGTNVSGGQRQRLSIARAIAKNPEIYIFDDSFSALDFKTDKELRHALEKEIKDATILIVAQRISTIMNADQILVLDEGKIVGCGRHKELLKTCKVYQEIAESQLSKEELGNE